MPISKDTLSAWNSLLLSEKKHLTLSELEFSALSSWVLDIDRSYNNVYLNLLIGIENSDVYNSQLLHDYVEEIYFDLKHIKDHIEAAENGFLELMKAFAVKSDN